MLGPILVGRKAASWGYKRYGIPGAVATGVVGLAGYYAARRALRRVLGGDRTGGKGSRSGDRVESTTPADVF